MSIFANPDPLLFRLFTQSASTLSATEQVKTRKGDYRVSVTKLANAKYLWRIEEWTTEATKGVVGA